MQKFSAPEEGAGKAGCALHPRSRVQDARKNAHTSIQVQRRQSGLPCAMVLTAYFVLSPVIGLSCHRRPAKPGMSAPGWADFAFARLDAGVEASGPHDFTVRGRLAPKRSTGVVPIRRSPGEGVFGIVRQRALSSLTGKARPATFRAPDAAASTASRPNVRDDGQRPSAEQDAGSYRVIWVFGKSEYFCERGWTE